MKKTYLTILFLCSLSISTLFAKSGKNSIGMEMVEIPAGYFWMGSIGWGENYDEAPAHKVTISNSFLMGTTEVTNKQYEMFAPEHKKYRGVHGLSIEDDEAVVFISYEDAIAFCKWLSDKEGKTYRLPTEAEWEYACRAGSFSSFWMDDRLPEIYQKNQGRHRNPIPVSTEVGKTPPNLFGLYDMHGNVEEWCLDWYGPYQPDNITDPGGASEGLFRITRGGSHGTPVKHLRSANRMAMIPEDKHWLTGFRIVQSDYPKVSYSSPAPIPPCMSNIKQNKFEWPQPSDKALFEEPITYIHQPDCNLKVPFYSHHHCPAITWSDNGDLLAIWFSCDEESGREMNILASRLRTGSKQWDDASEFFKVPDRNMTGSSLLNDGTGRLIYTNGVEAAGDWQNLAIVKRESHDNGATWSTPELIAPEHQVRHQVIAGMIKTKEGWLIQPADARAEGQGGTAIHISKDNGKTWYDPGEGKSNDFKEGGFGGSIAGIHAGVVQLKNGNLMAFGRGNSIVDKNGLQRMPLSISENMGETWKYTASEFPPIDGGQRLVLLRLNEGPILLISFTNHPTRIKDGQKGLVFKDQQGKEYTGYGLYATLSWDEGKTWPVKKLLTDGKERFLDGGAWTGYFHMDSTHAESKGYMAATQSPDNVIHLLSSKVHYRFNLQWLTE